MAPGPIVTLLRRGGNGKVAPMEKLASPRAVEKRAYAPGPAGHWLLGSMQEFRADSVGFLLDASKAYGDLVHFRLGPAHVHLVNSAELARAVLVDRTDEFHRSALTKSVFGRVMGDGLLVSDGAFHKRQRRLSQPAFVSKRVDACAPTIANLVERQIAGWSDGREIVIDQEMETLSLAVVAKTLFGADLAEQAARVTGAMRVLQEEMRSLFRSVVGCPRGCPSLRTSVCAAPSGTSTPFFTRPSGFDAPPAGTKATCSRCCSRRSIRTARARWTTLSSEDEAITLFLAGFETVANGLTWLWYALATNPEVERELHAELDARAAQGASAAADVQSTLLYTEMVVKETLRLFSPILGVQSRTHVGHRAGRVEDPTGRNSRHQPARAPHEPEVLRRAGALLAVEVRARRGAACAARRLPPFRSGTARLHRGAARDARDVDCRRHHRKALSRRARTRPDGGAGDAGDDVPEGADRGQAAAARARHARLVNRRAVRADAASRP